MRSLSGESIMMLSRENLTLYHAPGTRGTGVMILLEELGVEYDLHVLNLARRQQRRRAYRLVNPMRKVPALKHGEVLITEQVAILLYLADMVPAAELAPLIGERLRGPYLRWMVFYGTCFEPAVYDRWQQRTTEVPAMSPYGDFDTTFKTVTDQLARGPYLLGDQYSAADVLWATALTWISQLNILPPTAVIDDYIARINARPAVAQARAKDAALAAAQA
jgi:glutathione S-transferase